MTTKPFNIYVLLKNTILTHQTYQHATIRNRVGINKQCICWQNITIQGFIKQKSFNSRGHLNAKLVIGFYLKGKYYPQRYVLPSYKPFTNLNAFKVKNQIIFHHLCKQSQRISKLIYISTDKRIQNNDYKQTALNLQNRS